MEQPQREQGTAAPTHLSYQQLQLLQGTAAPTQLSNQQSQLPQDNGVSTHMPSYTLQLLQGTAAPTQMFNQQPQPQQATTTATTPLPNQQPAQNTLTPTCTGVFIDNSWDAITVLTAVLSGQLNTVTRRPQDSEKDALIISGRLYVYEEERSGIKRWTDRRVWGPSRILENFLVYRELERPLFPEEREGGAARANPGHVTAPRPARGAPRTNPDGSRTKGSIVGSMTSNNYPLLEDGLVKKTITLKAAGATFHIVLYFTWDDVNAGKLLTPQKHPLLSHIIPDTALLTGQNFKVQVEVPAWFQQYLQQPGLAQQPAVQHEPAPQLTPAAPYNQPPQFSPAAPFDQPPQFSPATPCDPAQQFSPSAPFDPASQFPPATLSDPVPQFTTAAPYELASQFPTAAPTQIQAPTQFPPVPQLRQGSNPGTTLPQLQPTTVAGLSYFPQEPRLQEEDPDSPLNGLLRLQDFQVGDYGVIDWTFVPS